MTDALTSRLSRATAHIPGPLAVVDLDAFDANAADLLRRAGGVAVRVASKSVRVRSLISRAVAKGFRGVMAYSLAEALWLAEEYDDVLVAYPSVDQDSLAKLASDEGARKAITVMIDHPDHLSLLSRVSDRAGDPQAPIQICLDIDASLRIGRGPVTVHLGTRRSPVHTAADALTIARRIVATPGVRLRGIMTYEAQVAGLPDTGVAVRAVKRLSVREMTKRRLEVIQALERVVGHRLELVNAGGTGSLEVSSQAPGVSEVTAGSGLYVPGIFDGYRAFRPRPAAFFGLDVVRVPAPGWATAFGGGYIGSGPAATSRLPRVVTPGWSLTAREGAGEVQTPLRRRRRGVAAGPRAESRPLAIGDRVWFRHAKAGELMERVDQVHLVRDDRIVGVVGTYRGLGRNFG